ncbi:LysR family transcriptional regulator [Aliiroseovarius sp.]|uniref:LysR family transcriptional regulator n=1 Tax=Aliiroseovarius sp. TaxID=1872442 RepID=UPI003BAC7F66
MDWRDIPSLSALRAFEAMARLGSFSAAARELNVTHAAVAQHVRGLEAEFGESLARRAGSGMELTEEGQRLAAALSQGFGQIAAGVRELRQARGGRPIQVTLTPSFAENWLMPRLGGFRTAHPDLPIALIPHQGVSDLVRDGYDLGLRFGRGDWPGVEAQMLVPANFVVVGRPDILEGVDTDDLSALATLPWYVEEGWDETRLWAEAAGLDLSFSDVTPFPINTMVLSAVRAGLGVAMQAHALVESDLKSGNLVLLHQAAPSELGYYIVTPEGGVSPRVKLLIDWLKSVA